MPYPIKPARHFLALCLFCIGADGLMAQHAQTWTKDTEIASMVSKVSPDSLKSYIAQMESFGTRHTLSTQTDPQKGIGAAKRWVLSKFNAFAEKSNGRLTALIDDSLYRADGRRVDKDIILGNVVATLKGTDPNDKRIFMITGHLDSRVNDVMDSLSTAPGANDDASGVAALIECARIMSEHPFSATVVFAALSGEEQGLLGARYMASKYKRNNQQIEALLNNDIIANSKGNGTALHNNTQVRVFSMGLPAAMQEDEMNLIRSYSLENDGTARQLARYVKETGERYVDNLEVVMIYRNDRFGRGGDHTPFVQEGYAAVRITEMNENFTQQHQDIRVENGIEYGDLSKFIDFEYLRKNTALNLASLANLAKSPPAPIDVRIGFVRGEMPNTTSLAWARPVTGTPAGYYVLIRKTTDHTWQKKVFTDQTEINLPYTKDNYLFAVQSVSDDGNEGLPVFPSLGRR